MCPYWRVGIYGNTGLLYIATIWDNQPKVNSSIKPKLNAKQVLSNWERYSETAIPDHK
jgi:hypothetical protein